MQAVEIIRALGGATRLAKRLEVKRSAISMWPRSGIPPRHWLPLARIAAATPGCKVSLSDIECHKPTPIDVRLPRLSQVAV